MKRNLADLESRTFDLAVIGGGVMRSVHCPGMRCGGAWARRFLEMNDFACAASEAMSHTIHGGIRYLAQGRTGMVREALSG